MIDFIKRHWFALLFVAALLARLPQLASPLWYDESWTQWISGLPFTRMMAAVAGDVHPPLFFALTWLVGRISLAPWALRMVPLACSLLTLLATRRLLLALRLPVAAQVVALMLVALSPWQIYYSSELRMYTLLELAFVMGASAVVDGDYLAMGFWMVVLCYTQNYGLMYSAVLGLWALRVGRYEIDKPITFGVVALVAYLPWALTGLRMQLAQVGAGYWIGTPTLPDVMLTVYYWLAGYIDGGLQVVVMVLAIWLTIMVIMRRDWELQWLTFGPIMLALIVSAWRPIYLSRALLPCSIPFYILIGKALADLRLPGRVAAVGFLVPAFVLAIVCDNSREVMIQRYRSPEVAALIAQGPTIQPIYYFGLSSLVELHQWSLPNPQYVWSYNMSIQSGSYSLATRQALGIDERELAAVPAGPVWLVAPINGYGHNDDMQAQVDAVLRDYPSRLVMELHGKENYGVEVYELWR